MSDLGSLTEFCTVRQLEILEAVIKNGSHRKAAQALGCASGLVSNAMVAIKRKAALQGWSPEHDLTHPAAPGQRLQGASTLYRRGEIEPVLQWVKTSRDAEQQAAMQQAAIEAMCETIPKVLPIVCKGAQMAHLCNVYTITDAHVGALAWDVETQSGDWDLAIAEKTLVGCFTEMINASPKAETCVIAQLGDYCHYDSAIAPVTPLHGNALDADGRMPKMVKVAIRALRAMIDAALSKHKKVVLLIAEGNHDISSSVWLRAMFQTLYENEPRIQVIDSELPYYVYQHGETMLAWHHGHLAKNTALPMLFAAQFPKVWGGTSKRYAHTGHKHHTEIKEFSGMTVTQHPTLAARDAYAARGGWIAERQATAVTYSNKFGLVATNTVTPEMLQ